VPGRIYIGDLPQGCRDSDLEHVFRRYGRIVNIAVLEKKGMHFAFIDFTDRFVSCRVLCGLRGAAFLTPPSPIP
jgi:hypothetical protein